MLRRGTDGGRQLIDLGVREDQFNARNLPNAADFRELTSAPALALINRIGPEIGYNNAFIFARETLRENHNTFNALCTEAANNPILDHNAAIRFVDYNNNRLNPNTILDDFSDDDDAFFDPPFIGNSRETDPDGTYNSDSNSYSE
jgi:hypothetical protein